MFKHINAAISLIKKDLLKWKDFLTYTTIFFTIVYFIYAFLTDRGNFIANITLAVFFSIYSILTLVFDLYGYKNAKKIVKNIYKYLKLFVKFVLLGTTIYGIYTASQNVTIPSILLICITTIAWIAQFLVQLISNILGRQLKLLQAAFSEDFKSLNPINKIKNKFNKEQIESPKSRELTLLEDEITKTENHNELIKETKKQEKFKLKLRKKAKNTEKEFTDI